MINSTIPYRVRTKCSRTFANTRITKIDSDVPLPAAPAPQISHKYEPIPFNAQTINPQQYSEPFNKLLNEVNDPTIPDEQKQRLKIAFAEGYLTATHPDHANRSGKAMRYLKVLQQLLIIVVFIGIFISLFVSTNGSVFRSAINLLFCHTICLSIIRLCLDHNSEQHSKLILVSFRLHFFSSLPFHVPDYPPIMIPYFQ